MAYAFMYPDPEKGGRGKKSENRPAAGQFSKQRLSDARVVLRHSPDLADRVIKGSMSLDDALAETQQRQTNERSEESRLAMLREKATLSETNKVSSARLSQARFVSAPCICPRPPGARKIIPQSGKTPPRCPEQLP